MLGFAQSFAQSPSNYVEGVQDVYLLNVVLEKSSYKGVENYKPVETISHPDEVKADFEQVDAEEAALDDSYSWQQTAKEPLSKDFQALNTIPTKTLRSSMLR